MNEWEKKKIGIQIEVSSVHRNARIPIQLSNSGMDIYADQHTRHIHLPTLSSKQQQQYDNYGERKKKQWQPYQQTRNVTKWESQTKIFV